MQIGCHCATRLVKDHGGNESINCVDYSSKCGVQCNKVKKRYMKITTGCNFMRNKWICRGNKSNQGNKHKK